MFRTDQDWFRALIATPPGQWVRGWQIVNRPRRTGRAKAASLPVSL